MREDSHDRLRTRLIELDLESPCIVGSSVLTGDIERIRLAQRFGAGAISTKLALPTTPPYARPDIIIRPRGQGLISPGDRRLILEDACKLIERAKTETKLPVFANMFAPPEDLESWERLARGLWGAGADALELNFSCPTIINTVNAKPGIPVAASIAQRPEIAERIIRSVKGVVDIPVVCNLTPQVADIVEVAAVCQRAGADAVVAINSFRAAPPIDIWNGGRPKFTSIEKHNLGAVTGPPIFPIACRMVAEIARAVDVPIIGNGGISTWQDAVEMMMWGARAVSMCTSILLHGFETVERINSGIAKFMAEQGYHSTDDFIGAALDHMVPSNQIEYRKFDLSVNKSRCNMCRRCLEPGICLALTARDGAMVVDNDRCLDCGTCVQLCPKRAFEVQFIA